MLASHRGWDPGAAPLARILSRRLQAPMWQTTVTRLLVEANRSPGHPDLFSKITRPLPDSVRERILRRYYHPHRNRVTSAIDEEISNGHRVLHCGVHTFTPNLDGQIRNADVGLLYDPNRPLETEFCHQWQGALRRCRACHSVLPLWQLKIRRNYPYRGNADGLTTSLRRQFPADRYLGIELEVNQKWVDTPEWKPLCRFIADSLQATLDGLGSRT